MDVVKSEILLPAHYPRLPRITEIDESIITSCSSTMGMSVCTTTTVPSPGAASAEESLGQEVSLKASQVSTYQPAPAVVPKRPRKKVMMPTCPSKSSSESSGGEIRPSVNQVILEIMDKDKARPSAQRRSSVGGRKSYEKHWYGWIILNEFKPFILVTESDQNSTSDEVPEPDEIESNIIQRLLMSSQPSVFRKRADSEKSVFRRAVGQKTAKHYSLSDVQKYRSTFVRQESGLSADLKELHQAAGDAGTNVPTLFKEEGSQASSTEIRLFDVTTSRTAKNACLLKEADREKLYLMFTPSDENILEIVNNIQIRNKILRHDVGNIVLKIKLGESQKDLFKTCTNKEIFPQNKLPSIIPIKIRRESSFNQEVPINDETLYEKYYLDYTIEKNGYYILVRERPLLAENIRLSVVPKMSIQKTYKEQVFSPHHSRKSRAVKYSPIKIQSDVSVGAFKSPKTKKERESNIILNQFNEDEIIKSIMDDTILNKSPCNKFIEVCLDKAITKLKREAEVRTPSIAPPSSEVIEEEESRWDELDLSGEKARAIRDRIKGIRRKKTLLLTDESSEIITSDELLLLERERKKDSKRKTEEIITEKVFDEAQGYTKQRPSKWGLDYLDEQESVIDSIDAIEHEMKATRVNVDCKPDPVEQFVIHLTDAESGKKCLFLDRFQQYKSLLHTKTAIYKHEPSAKLRIGGCINPIIAGMCWRDSFEKCYTVPNELYPYGIYYQPITMQTLDEIRHEHGTPTFTYDQENEEFKGLAPSTTLKNSDKELVLLNYCDHFLRNYYEKNYGRMKLFLCVLNEYGVQKVVPTTLRPTQISYNGMDDMKEIAKFVSNNLHYVSLRIPTALPHDMKSPSYVLRKGEGSPFELSNVLASLLLGAGYNALVVSGYASIMLTEVESHHNYPRFVCPYLIDSRPTDPFEVFTTKAQTTKEAERNYKEIKFDNRYVPSSQAYLGSNYLKELMETEQEETFNEKNRIARETEENLIREFEQAFEEDDIEGKRIHSWVAVLPGTRGISNVIYIEPATGHVYQPDDPYYIGIESVWNQYNYWINRNFTKNQEINWDLSNTDFWIPLLTNGPIMNVPRPKNIIKKFQSLQKNLDMPNSWAPKITITCKQMERRIHEIYKLRVYRKSVCFDYQSGSNSVGMVAKVLSFNDFQKANLSSITEMYEKRSDNLYRKVKNACTDDITEYFSFGRPDCLKTHRYFGEQKKIFHDHELEFYSESRPDGLQTIEFAENRMTLNYSGRKDNLKKVKVIYGRYLKATIPNTQTYTKEIMMISQEFDRSPEIPPWEDIALVYFRLKKNDIVVYYHFETERISQMVRIIYKPDVNDQEVVLVNNNWKETNVEEDEKEHIDLEDHEIMVEESFDKSFVIERDESLPNIYQYRSEKSYLKNDEVPTFSSALVSSISKDSMESIDSSQSFAVGNDDLECIGSKVPTLFPAILTADKDKLLWACSQKRKVEMEELLIKPSTPTLKAGDSVVTKISTNSNVSPKDNISINAPSKSTEDQKETTSSIKETDEGSNLDDQEQASSTHSQKTTFFERSFEKSVEESIKQTTDVPDETFDIKINEFDHFTRESSRASTNEEEEYIRELYAHHLQAVGEIKELSKESARGETNPDVEFIVGLISVPKNPNICQCKLDKFYARLSNIFQENPIHYKSTVEKSHQPVFKMTHNKSILVPDDIDPKYKTLHDKQIEDPTKYRLSSLKVEAPTLSELEPVNRRTYKNCLGCKTSDELLNLRDKRDWKEFHGFESIVDDLKEYLHEELKRKAVGNKATDYNNTLSPEDKPKQECLATCDCNISETESALKCDLKQDPIDEIIEQKKILLEKGLSIKPENSDFKQIHQNKNKKSSVDSADDDEEYIDLFSKTDQEIDEIILNLQDDLVRCQCEDKKNHSSPQRVSEREHTYDIQDRYNCSCCKKDCETYQRGEPKKEKNTFIEDDDFADLDDKESENGFEVDISDVEHGGSHQGGAEKDEDSIEGDNYSSDNNYSQVTSRAESSECLSGLSSTQTSNSDLSQLSTIEAQGGGPTVHEPYTFKGFHYNAGKMNVRKLYQVKEVCDSTLVESDNDSEQGEEDEYDLKFLEDEIDKFLTNTIDRSQEHWREARTLIGVMRKGSKINIDANHISSFYCTINDQYINYVDGYFKKINKNREMQNDKSFVNELKKKKAKEAGKIISNLRNYYNNLKNGLPAQLDDDLMHLIPHIRPVITKKKDRLGYEILDDSDDNELNTIEDSAVDEGSVKQETVYVAPLSVTLKTEELLSAVADNIQQRAVSRAIKKFEKFKAIEEGLLEKSLESNTSDTNLRETLKTVNIFDGYFLDPQSTVNNRGIIKNDVKTDISFITEVESIPLFKNDQDADDEDELLNDTEITQEGLDLLRHMEAVNACGKERIDEAEFYEKVYRNENTKKGTDYSDIGIETFRLFQPLPKHLLESDTEGSICDRIKKKRRKLSIKEVKIDDDTKDTASSMNPSDSVSLSTTQENELSKIRALPKLHDNVVSEGNEFKMDFFKKCRLQVKNASSNEDMSNIKRAEIIVKFFTLEQEAVSFVRQQEYYIHHLLEKREEESAKPMFNTLISSKVSIRKSYYTLLRKKLHKWFKMKDMLSFEYDLLKPYLHLLINGESPKKMTYETADYIVRCVILDFIERDIYKIKRMFQAYEKARELTLQKIQYFENILNNFSITGPDHFKTLVDEYNRLLMQIADKAHIIRFQIARYTKLSTKRFKTLLLRLSEDKRIKRIYDMARERIIQMDLMKRWPEFFEKTTHFLGLPVPSEPNDIVTSYMSPTYNLILKKIANRVKKRPARYSFSEDTYYKFYKLMDEEGDYLEELESKEQGETKKEKPLTVAISESDLVEGTVCQSAKDKNTIFIDKPDIVNNLNWRDFYLISNVAEEPREKILEEETVMEIKEEKSDFGICTEAIIEEIILLKHLMELQEKTKVEGEVLKESKVGGIKDDLEEEHKQRDLIYIKYYGTHKHKEMIENRLIKFFERV